MSMHKKDYEAIARIIASHGHYMPHTQSSADDPTVAVCTPEWMALLCISRDVADYCASQDPTFKRDRFLSACGVSQS